VITNQSKATSKATSKPKQGNQSKATSKRQAKMMTRSKTGAITGITGVTGAPVPVVSSNVPVAPDNTIVYPSMFDRWAEPL